MEPELERETGKERGGGRADEAQGKDKISETKSGGDRVMERPSQRPREMNGD